MTKTTENDNSQNVGYSFEDSELEGLKELEGDALKEKVTELFEGKGKKVLESNRQLFARAKKAEGFEQNEEGEWVKTTKPAKPEAKKSEKSDNMVLERLDKMALKVAGITEADEVELFSNWKEQTGREADDIVGNEIFTKELESLRTSKANLKATSDIKGTGDGSGGAKTNPDYWIAKATKGADGKLLFSDETPKELYSKILDKMAAGEPSSSGNLKFYNEK